MTMIRRTEMLDALKAVVNDKSQADIGHVRETQDIVDIVGEMLAVLDKHKESWGGGYIALSNNFVGALTLLRLVMEAFDPPDAVIASASKLADQISNVFIEQCNAGDLCDSCNSIKKVMEKMAGEGVKIPAPWLLHAKISPEQEEQIRKIMDELKKLIGEPKSPQNVPAAETPKAT